MYHHFLKDSFFFKSNFKFTIKLRRKTQRFFYIPFTPTHASPPIINIRMVIFFQEWIYMDTHIIEKVHSWPKGLFSVLYIQWFWLSIAVVSCETFSENPLYSACSSLSHFLPHWQSPFPESHRVRITEYVAFSYWLLPLSNISSSMFFVAWYLLLFEC